MGNAVAEAAQKLTYEDYCKIPDDGLRHEIIDGVEYVSPSPSNPHQGVSIHLASVLWTFLRKTGLGTVRNAPFDLLLGPHDVVVPDLMVVLATSRDRIRRNGCHGAPDLVVEILSPSNPSHDVVRKRRLYERAGVLEYWILDPETARAELYRRAGADGFAPPAVRFADRGESLDTPLLPGFTLALADLFAPDPEVSD